MPPVLRYDLPSPQALRDGRRSTSHRRDTCPAHSEGNSLYRETVNSPEGPASRSGNHPSDTFARPHGCGVMIRLQVLALHSSQVSADNRKQTCITTRVIRRQTDCDCSLSHQLSFPGHAAASSATRASHDLRRHPITPNCVESLCSSKCLKVVYCGLDLRTNPV